MIMNQFKTKLKKEKIQNLKEIRVKFIDKFYLGEIFTEMRPQLKYENED